MNGVHMKYDTLIEEDKDASPVGSRGIGGNAENRAVEGVTVFQPVFILMSDGWIVKDAVIVTESV